MAKETAESSPEYFHAEWPLRDCRATKAEKLPGAHQTSALTKLGAWYRTTVAGHKGGILALPTGAGKTFTAIHFLCNGPLSDGYKVLWLAHTHHLLEQAFRAFAPTALKHIREPRETLSVRVVSGTPGHYPPRDIKTSDDIVIATLQTITHANREKLATLQTFLAAAKGKLFVVFDEAHHAPAPSYRKLLEALRTNHGATLLGLTATPTYSNEAKRGWLSNLFPQEILAQAKATDLMASGVLAKPHFESHPTSITPDFDEREYQKWLGTYRDVPENVIALLAKNEKRNGLIASRYVQEKEKYGKTIIFTDRWAQCEAIVEALHKRDKTVRAAAVYSHVDATMSADKRAKRDKDENARVLARFRKDAKEKDALDVIVNIRMLTEGTDLPDAKTVFLTRQTTSQILLTQMVGRALRGPKFGGTAEAHIVSFVDDWQQAIRWAEYGPLDGGRADGGDDGRERRVPLQLISIDLVKRLARQMDSGINVTTGPFLSLMPAGWYRVTFDVRTPDSDDVETPQLLVLVFDDERKGFEATIAELAKNPQKDIFGEDDADFEACRPALDALRLRHLDGVTREPSDVLFDLFQVARHIAQDQGAPTFFAYDARQDHDLDAIAQRLVSLDLRRSEEAALLQDEYARKDRFWRTLFPRYEQFRSFYDACVNRPPPGGPPIFPGQSEPPSRDELTDQEKQQLFRRDGNQCLACGATKYLQADHVHAVYFAGSNRLDNLQTLCKICNGRKGTRTIRFTTQSTTLREAPKALAHFDAPSEVGDRWHWERFMRQTLNFTFECGAVSSVTIGGRGETYYNWMVELVAGNSPRWIEPHLPHLFERVQEARRDGGKPELDSLSILAPGETTVSVKRKK